MNPIIRLAHWIGRPGRLRRQARNTTDAGERASLLSQAAEGSTDAAVHLEAAAALAQAGRHADAMASWRRCLHLQPLRVPTDAQLAALDAVMPQVAQEVLDTLVSPRKTRRHWKMERRGTLDGEERWRMEQETHWTFAELMPTLRYIALAVAHTTAAPGRLRIDCDRLERGGDEDDRMLQMGEAIVTWDGDRRITNIRVQE